MLSALSPRCSAGAGAAALAGHICRAARSVALIQTLNAELLASRSATQTLRAWCGDHQLAGGAEDRGASCVTGVDKAPSADQRQRLQVAAPTTVKYRHVQLQCGTRVLSEADNWYVPGRLTAEMNRLLETTETPFGTVVRPLEPSRQTLAVTMLWSPLPERWDRDGRQRCGTRARWRSPTRCSRIAPCSYTREHVPFSEVYEVYQRQILAFPPPAVR